jgi:hypothetical protein
MSDLNKLKKLAAKAEEATKARRAELDAAISNYALAVGAQAVAQEKLEDEEAMSVAREMRKGKPEK